MKCIYIYTLWVSTFLSILAAFDLWLEYVHLFSILANGVMEFDTPTTQKAIHFWHRSGPFSPSPVSTDLRENFKRYIQVIYLQTNLLQHVVEALLHRTELRGNNREPLKTHRCHHSPRRTRFLRLMLGSKSPFTNRSHGKLPKSFAPDAWPAKMR